MKNKLEKMERKVNGLEVLLGSMVIMTILSFIFAIWIGTMGVKVFFNFLNITLSLAIYKTYVNIKFKEMQKKPEQRNQEIDKAAELLSHICQNYEKCFAEECPFMGGYSICDMECEKKDEWYKYLKGER